jgi:hypothetical protein
MDEKIEQALKVANYMATLSNQRRIIFEEFNQKVIYYVDGATFKIDTNLINFVKIALDLGHTHEVSFLDSNNFPVVINDVQEFFDNIVSVYFEALNEYTVAYQHIKSKRKIGDIVEL